MSVKITTNKKSDVHDTVNTNAAGFNEKTRNPTCQKKKKFNGRSEIDEVGEAESSRWRQRPRNERRSKELVTINRQLLVPETEAVGPTTR